MNQCKWCNSHNISTFNSLDENGKDFLFYECEQCESIEIAPFDVQAYYDSEYYGAEDEKFKWPFNKLFYLSKTASAKKYSSYVNNNGAILDIGAGRGDLLKCLYELGHTNLVGTELSENKGAFTKVEWAYGADAIKQSKANHFDLVTAIHVFEHLEEPDTIINDIAERVKTNGYLILQYPSVVSRQFKWFKAKWFHLDTPRHLHLVSYKKLVEKLEALGFELTSVSDYAMVYDPFGYIQSILNVIFGGKNFFYNNLKKGVKLKGIKSYIMFLAQGLVSAFVFPFVFVLSIIDSMQKKGATVEVVLKKVG